MKIDNLFDTNDLSALARIITKLNISLNRFNRKYRALHKAYQELKKQVEKNGN